MTFMEWRKDLSINVQEIDNQHKFFLQLLNKLHKSVFDGKGRETLENILKELVDYSEEHFKTEEELMQTQGYNDFITHKQEHDDLREKVLGFVGQFNNGNDAICTKLLLFLEDWLLLHLSSTDKDLGIFLNKINYRSE